jgi:hypothetical protein
MGEMARYDCWIECGPATQLRFTKLEMTDVLNLLHLVQNAVIHERYDRDRQISVIISLHEEIADGES